MFKRIPMLALFVLLGAAVALLPVACSSSSSGGDDASVDMTGS
jgi:hypothetical protein